LPLIVLLGPTASGKTGLSIDMARWASADLQKTIEIVNADSRQFYAHLDIGTAKITPDEMQGVAHHLLSVLDPKQDCTIAWFQKEATRVIAEIHARGNVPMLVGGSMLYISAVIDGLQPMASDPAKRTLLEAEYDKDAGVSLHARLTTLDPESGRLIPRENKVYVIRAMEIVEASGDTKMSQLRAQPPPYDLLLLGVYREREALIKRIDLRTHSMLHAGWIDEVRGLLAKGYSADDPGMNSHGYPEIIAALQSGTDPLTVEPLISAKTRQYAKRQMTWWRGDERIRWIALAD
jgi:tRNA dimethylallyltransferase